jgi:hypothetical protein
MRTQIKVESAVVIFDLILEALGQELIDASDEEIMEAAKDLGMDLQMKGSAAFLGLTFPARWSVSDVFDLEVIKERKPKTPSTIRSRISADKKRPGRK